MYFLLYNGRVLDRLGLYIDRNSNAAAMLAMVTIAALVTRSARKQAKPATNRLPWYDVILILGALVAFGYPFVLFGQFRQGVGSGFLPPLFQVLAVIAVVTLLEAGRRILGLVLTLVVALFIAYLFLTEYVPGIMGMHDLELARITWQLYASDTSSIFGIPAQTAATIVIMFIIFSAFLERTGATQFLINLALSLFGHLRGGPAKAAVVGSLLFGTFSGSPSANVVGTGVVTIPLMKSVGYKPEFAGAVEAAASTGGQLMPPVMGTIAFIAAEWLGIPYLSLCVAAAVPAVLYFLAVFIMVDSQAAKLGLRGIPRAELPRLGTVLKNGWYWFLPIAVILITLAVFRYDAAYCGFLAFLSVIPLSYVKKKDRLTPKTFAASMQRSLESAVSPGLACGLAGAIIAVVAMSGIGFKLSGLIVLLARGSMPLLLIFAALSATILGMGMSSIAVYVVVVVLVAPVLIKMGVTALAAHLFVLYYGMLSFVTPPVAIAAFVAASIADSKPFATAIWATRLAIVGFLIPFALIYDPAIMLKGAALDILKAIALATAGTIAIGFGSGGYWLTPVNLFQRLLFVVGGFMLYLPHLLIPGVLTTGVAVLWHVLQWRRSRPALFTSPVDQKPSAL